MKTLNTHNSKTDLGIDIILFLSTLYRSSPQFYVEMNFDSEVKFDI